LSIIDTTELRILDDFEQHFGKQDDPEPVEQALAQDKPNDPVEHTMQIMAQSYEGLAGKPYTDYAILIYDRFQDVKSKSDVGVTAITTNETLALGCFLWAYKDVTGRDMPIPGALTDKKYWLKTIRKHLDNYPLIQLAVMYPLAIRNHFESELTFKSPDSISGGLVETYQTVKAHILAKQANKNAMANALNQTAHEPTESEILQDTVETTLNWAKGKDGSEKNSNIMWRGIIFKTEADKNLVLDYYSQWDKHIDHETENTMREKLEAGELLLESPLRYSELGDIFHFRTADEDKLLFRSLVFTQRATRPDFDPIAYRRLKNEPLADNLEHCPLPNFYEILQTPAHKMIVETGVGRLNSIIGAK